MAELIEIVDALENRMSKVLHKLEVLQQHNQSLTQELNRLKGQQQTDKEALEAWEEKYNSLKLANSMLGSNTTNKTEAKLKINTLIREIDSCIAQLAE